MKILTHQIDEMGKDYISFLEKEGVYEELVTYLFTEADDKKAAAGKDNQVMPIKWLEAKIQRMRKIAIESSKSLSHQTDDVKAYLMDEKEIIFKITDPVTQNVVRTNSYLSAAYNLHRVSPSSVFQCVMANELNFAGEPKVMKNGLVVIDYDEFAKLDDRTLSIMNASEAILTNLPDDADVEKTFSKIVNIFKEDSEKPKKK